MSQPCSAKIGPNRNGFQTSRTPASRQSASIRIAATYEYVLANSNQNSKTASDGMAREPFGSSA